MDHTQFYYLVMYRGGMGALLFLVLRSCIITIGVPPVSVVVHYAVRHELRHKLVATTCKSCDCQQPADRRPHARASPPRLGLRSARCEPALKRVARSLRSLGSNRTNSAVKTARYVTHCDRQPSSHWWNSRGLRC